MRVVRWIFRWIFRIVIGVPALLFTILFVVALAQGTTKSGTQGVPLALQMQREWFAHDDNRRLQCRTNHERFCF